LEHHRVVIVGGGTADITVAARLCREGVKDLAVIEPSSNHSYQPLWTLVGAGIVNVAKAQRPEAKVMPKGMTWVHDAVVSVDPDEQYVSLEARRTVGYDHLVVCSGIQLDWGNVDGLTQSLGRDGVVSNYLASTAPKTWESIRTLRSGTAIFTMPSGPIKCAGAPQKNACLAADYWQRQGVLGDINVVLALPAPSLFGVPEFAKVLEGAVVRYGIEVRFEHELSEIHGETKELVLIDKSDDDNHKENLRYDMVHVVPPQRAPNWVKESKLSDPENPAGYVAIDKHTMRHNVYPNVFSLGDAGSSPNSKTGATIRSQAPVLAANLVAAMADKPMEAAYDGYASCPLTTAHNRMVLAEFDYTMTPRPSVPLINTQKNATTCGS
jgi:sulfide:quinone oxidoreductase